MLFSIRQSHHKQISHAIAFRTVNDPLAVGRRLRVIVQRAVGGVCQPLGLAIERDSKQFDVVADLGRVEDRLAIDRPHRDIAAAAVIVGHIQKLGHASIAAPIGELLQAGAVGLARCADGSCSARRKRTAPTSRRATTTATKTNGWPVCTWMRFEPSASAR